MINVSTDEVINANSLWQTLTEAHERDLLSDYTIVVSSVEDIDYNTRYYLRAAESLMLMRKGPTQEIIEGTDEETPLTIKADKNYVSTYSAYNITTKGNETIKSLTSQSIYMGLYAEDIHGMTASLSLSRASINLGLSVMINIGMKLSMMVANKKLYVGGVVTSALVQTTFQLRSIKHVDYEVTQNVVSRILAMHHSRDTRGLNYIRGTVAALRGTSDAVL